jgi:uncharacterized iron-regulated membrane protein
MAKNHTKPGGNDKKVLNDIHLWLGYSVDCNVCFSGTVYVFNAELTEKAAPHLYKVNLLQATTYSC